MFSLLFTLVIAGGITDNLPKGFTGILTNGVPRLYAQSNSPVALDSLVVAVDPFYPPFVSTNDKGEFVGFDIDLFNAIAAHAKINFIYMPTQFQYLLPGVVTRLYDVGCSCLFITPKRQEQMNFTNPYFATGSALIVSAKNSNIRSITDLTNEMTVSVLQNSASESFAKNNTPSVVLPVNKIIEGFNLLAAGDLDAVIADEESLLDYTLTHPGVLKSVGDLLTYHECGLTVSKGNLELLIKLNASLAEVKKNGTYDKIYHKWFGQRPIPKPPVAATTETVSAAKGVAVDTTPKGAVTTGTDLTGTSLTAASAVWVGNYYIAVDNTDTNTEARYQIITVAENGLWFSSESISQTLSSQPGLWQTNAQGDIEATHLLFDTSGLGRVIERKYQMTNGADDKVAGHYTVATYSATNFAQSPAASPIMTETVSFTGRRVTR